MAGKDSSATTGAPRVLLLSTITVIDDNDEALWTPLSILALATTLQHAGYEPILLDVQVDTGWREQVATLLDDERLVLFGVSTLTGRSILYALDVIEVVRQHRPDLPVVWGGYHASLAKAAILDEGWADYVVRGVGEPAIVPLARLLHEAMSAGPVDRRLLPESELRSVPNLTVRRDSTIVDTRTVATDLDELPPLDYRLIDPTRYYTPHRRNVSYITSYSCPWRCSYCAEPMHTLRKWRGLAADRVATGIRQLSDAYRPDWIDLVDPNFSSSPPRVQEVVKALITAGNQQRIACNMRASDVVRIARDMDLSELYQAGFRRIFLGLESGSDRLLTGILQKDSHVADARQACRLLERAGIEQFSSFIHDIPTETEQDSEQTMQLAWDLAKLGLNQQFHHFFIPFPATDLYNHLLRQAEIDPSRLTLRDWGAANTYGGWKALWPGRPDFRRHVLDRLNELKSMYPGKFSFPQTLPEVEPELTGIVR